MFQSLLGNKGNGEDLLDAVRNKNLSEIKELLKKGAHRETCTGKKHLSCSYGALALRTSLELWEGNSNATECQPIDIATYLLKNEVNANEIPTPANRDSESTLHCAVREGKINFVSLLLQYGADPMAQSRSGDTPIHLAAQLRNTDILSLLLQKEKGLTFNFMTDFLINIDVQNTSKDTPLHYALYSKNSQAANVLLNHGADPTILNDKNSSPLLTACEKNLTDIASLLIARDAHLETPNRDTKTPLFWACYHQNVQLVTLLLNKKVSTACPSSDPDSFWNNPVTFTPLQLACTMGNAEIVALLLQHKASLYTNTPSSAPSPLHLVCSGKDNTEARREIIDLLVDAGANINQTDPNGNTPLHVACASGNVGVIKKLLAHHPNCLAENKNYHTPLDKLPKDPQCSSTRMDIKRMMKEQRKAKQIPPNQTAKASNSGMFTPVDEKWDVEEITFEPSCKN